MFATHYATVIAKDAGAQNTDNVTFETAVNSRCRTRRLATRRLSRDAPPAIAQIRDPYEATW